MNFTPLLYILKGRSGAGRRYAHNVFTLPHVANLTGDPNAQISAQWGYSLEGQITP